MKTPQQMILWLRGAGLSQPKIAALVGTSQASISRIEAAKQHPDYRLGSAIADLYDRTKATKSKKKRNH